MILEDVERLYGLLVRLLAVVLSRGHHFVGDVLTTIIGHKFTEQHQCLFDTGKGNSM